MRPLSKGSSEDAFSQAQFQLNHNNWSNQERLWKTTDDAIFQKTNTFTYIFWHKIDFNEM